MRAFFFCAMITLYVQKFMQGIRNSRWISRLLPKRRPAIRWRWRLITPLLFHRAWAVKITVELSQRRCVMPGDGWRWALTLTLPLPSGSLPNAARSLMRSISRRRGSSTFLRVACSTSSSRGACRRSRNLLTFNLYNWNN